MKKLLYGTLALAVVGITFTLSSCEKNAQIDEPPNCKIDNYNYKSTLEKFDYQLVNGISSNSEISRIILDFYKKKYKSEVIYPQEIHNLLDNTVDQNFNMAIENNFLNKDDISKLKKFCYLASKAKSKKAIKIEVNNYKSSVYYSTLSNSKKTVIDNCIASVYTSGLIDNHKGDDEFIEFEISSECAWAIAAFTAASIGLATLTATTGGLATLAVVASYNIACVQLVQACKKH